jgi:RNA polymerase sigma-70 factor, ECF subfamily
MDSRLVVRAQRGDRGAFAGLVDAIGDRLHAIAFSVLRDRELARDAVQQTLLTAWQDLPRLRDPDRFDAWACRILVHNCRREGRRAIRWLPSSAVPVCEEPASPDETRWIVSRDRLERGFRRLSVDQRLVVVLAYYLDLTPTDIAERIGIPVGTVNSRLHRALATLHAAIDADERPVETAHHVQQEAIR